MNELPFVRMLSEKSNRVPFRPRGNGDAIFAIQARSQSGAAERRMIYPDCGSIQTVLRHQSADVHFWGNACSYAPSNELERQICIARLRRVFARTVERRWRFISSAATRRDGDRSEARLSGIGRVRGRERTTDGQNADQHISESGCIHQNTSPWMVCNSFQLILRNELPERNFGGVTIDAQNRWYPSPTRAGARSLMASTTGRSNARLISLPPL